MWRQPVISSMTQRSPHSMLIVVCIDVGLVNDSVHTGQG